MKWVRLYITVEGQSEKEFADRALRPHLAGYGIDVRSRVVVTNRKLGKRGGILDFDKIKGDIGRLMKEDRHEEARFTTMVDLYARMEICRWMGAHAPTVTTPEALKVFRQLEGKVRLTAADARR